MLVWLGSITAAGATLVARRPIAKGDILSFDYNSAHALCQRALRPGFCRLAVRHGFCNVQRFSRVGKLLLSRQPRCCLNFLSRDHGVAATEWFISSPFPCQCGKGSCVGSVQPLPIQPV